MLSYNAHSTALGMPEIWLQLERRYCKQTLTFPIGPTWNVKVGNGLEGCLWTDCVHEQGNIVFFGQPGESSSRNC
jgi:hypothetical protein